MVRENKILFIGPMGAGKTTAIKTLSDHDPVSTEARNTQTSVINKSSTTVALDYGAIQLDENQSVHLYGVPGQKRFQFMWSIVSKGALGGVLLIDCSQTDWQEQLHILLKEFNKLAQSGRLVVALNRASSINMSDTVTGLMAMNLVLPVFMADPRKKEELPWIIESIIANAELELSINE